MDRRTEWQSLFEAHFEEIYSYVAFSLAPDRETVMDVVQEVFLAAGRSHGQYRREASPLTWLRGIARNKVADHFRGLQSLRFQRELTEADSELPQRKTEEADDLRRATLVSIALHRLPQERAELLEQKYLDGLSVREIARRRGISDKAAESALTRARGEFREVHQRLCSAELVERGCNE